MGSRDIWNVPPTMMDAFLAECGAAATDEAAFASFRRGPLMSLVVENTGPQHVESQIQHALRFTSPRALAAIYARIETVDELGGPERAIASTAGQQFRLSGTTTRYAKTLVTMQSLFGTLDGLNIVEVGGGYGGLAAVICRTGRPASYRIIDLAEPAVLQLKFCTKAEVYLSATTLTLFQASQARKAPVDLLIACNSLSELSRPLLDVYLRDVVSRAHRGFIVWNGDYIPGGIPRPGAEPLIDAATGVRGRWLSVRPDMASYDEAKFIYWWHKL